MQRERLPNRRKSVSFNFEAAGLRYTAMFSRFDDGRVGELFLNNHRTNSQADINARDSAVVCSIALQHNVPIDVIRKALIRNADGSASGPLGVALDLICENEK